MNTYDLKVAVLLMMTPCDLLASPPEPPGEFACRFKYTQYLHGECNAHDPFYYISRFYESLDKLLNETASAEEYISFADEFCTEKLAIYNCYIEKVEPRLYECRFDAKLRDYFLATTYHSASLRYLCADNDHVMKEMFKKDGAECWKKFRSVECPSDSTSDLFTRSNYYCAYGDRYIECRPNYKPCEKENITGLWINMHVAAKAASYCPNKNVSISRKRI